jgi:hypothetical protein
MLEPLTYKLPVITADPLKGKPAPAPALSAYEDVRAYDELVAIDAYDALLAWLA